MTRIPLPGNGAEALQRGVEHGTSAFANLLGQGIQRAQMHQAHAHHQDTHAIQQQQQARLAELQPYVIEQYKQQAAAHPYIIEQYKQAAALAPYERQLKMAQINKAIAEQAQLEFDQNFVKQFMGGQAGQGGQSQGAPMQQSAAQMPGQQPGMPQGQGQPMVAPPSMQQIQQGFGGQQTHPVLAAKMKKLTGWDPNELSPEQKRAADIQQFREKEEIKKQMKGEEDLTKITPATRTKYQDVVREVNSIMPVMNELVELGGENFTGFKTAKDLKYLGKVKRIADVYMKAKGWPNTNDARNDAIDLFKKGKTENADEYKSRMQELQGELIHERDLASNALGSGKVSHTNQSSNMLKGRLNGKEINIHPSRRELFIEQGGELL